ncbi:MAG TPA: holo-ACP synthase [Nevskiaceae bacterium]|nr:holo-ACP synthase [Nevskiaceae bacterium]
MIAGVGVDLLEVARMAKAHARFGERLERRLLHPQERAALPAARQPARYLAKCFAAKEAFVKALGTGFVGVAHDEIGSVRDAQGRPLLVYSERLSADLQRRGISAGHLSLSDEGGQVIAMVVLERSADR